MRAIKIGLPIVLGSMGWPGLALAEAPGSPAAGSASTEARPGAAAASGTGTLEQAASMPHMLQASEAPGSSGTLAPLTLGAVGVDTGPAYETPAYLKKGHMSGFMGWSFAMPIGSVRNLTGEISPVGFELQFNGWLTSFLSIGVSGEWASFVDNRQRETVALNERTDVSAKTYNWMTTSSAHFLVHYFFLDRGPVLPYLGPHAGVSWTSFQIEAADLVDSDTDFSFNFGGEGGMLVPFGPYAPVGLVNLRYSDSPAANFRRVTNVQSLSLLLGIGF